MKSKDLAKWAREKGDILRVDHVVVTTPNGDTNGYGTLRVSGEKLVMKLTLSGPAELPSLTGAVSISRDEWWKITGRIEDRLPFSAAGIFPTTTHHQGLFVVQEAIFDLCSVSLVSVEEQARGAQVHEFFKGSNDENLADVLHGYAYLENHQLLHRNVGSETKWENPFLGSTKTSSLDTFSATCGDFEYGLVQTEGKKSAELHLRTRTGVKMAVADFTASFRALLQALAFVHGRHAWPQHEQIKQGDIVEVDEVYPPRRTARTACKILDERICHQGGDYGQMIEKTWCFFRAGGELTEAVSRTLYLVRSSGDNSVPFDVGMLSLCAVFEGLIVELHEKLGAPEDTPEAKDFAAAKAEMMAFGKKREAEKAPGFTRILNVVRSARKHRPIDSYGWLIEHLKLPSNAMNEAMDAWKVERNALAHGRSQDEESDDRIHHHGRIAGAINLIVARLVGYTGRALFSRFEDRYITL